MLPASCRCQSKCAQKSAWSVGGGERCHLQSPPSLHPGISSILSLTTLLLPLPPTSQSRGSPRGAGFSVGEALACYLGSLLHRAGARTAGPPGKSSGHMESEGVRKEWALIPDSGTRARTQKCKQGGREEVSDLNSFTHSTCRA